MRNPKIHLSLFLSGLLSLLPALVPGGSAHAQFFTLQDFGTCIDHPDSQNCRHRLEEPKPPAAEQEAQQPEPESAQAGQAGNGQAGAGQPQAHQEPPLSPKAQAAPSLEEIFRDIQTGSVTGEEMEALERHADTGEPQAVEVLAWCYFVGRGRNVDLVEAYRLYGKAASLNVPNATKNQRAVFARMTGAQRNEVAAAPAGERKP